MVSPELRKQFAKRGIELISPSDGCRRMDQELRYGRKGEVEVLLTAGGWGALREIQTPQQVQALPEAERAVPSRGSDRSLIANP
jgi:hypothetical protein